MVRQFIKPRPELNGQCDRCGARAKVRLIMPSERLLDFCGHHYHQHAEALVRQRATVLATVESP